MQTIDWKKIQLVVFDVDGTLYDQPKLRRLMAWELLKYYFIRPAKWMDLVIIYTFRKQRELLSEQGARGVGRLQYSAVASKLGVSVERVEDVIEQWVYRTPLKYMQRCACTEAAAFIHQLLNGGVKVAFLSDYPAVEKLRALELPFNEGNVFSATDPGIDAFKPNPKGLLQILETFGCLPEQTLLVGDRQDREGVMARKLGLLCVLVGSNPSKIFESIRLKL